MGKLKDYLNLLNVNIFESSMNLPLHSSLLIYSDSFMWSCVIVESSSQLVFVVISLFFLNHYCDPVLQFLERPLNSWLLLLLSLGRMMSSRASVEETCEKAFLVTF